jgi:hypothetical protein
MKNKRLNLRILRLFPPFLLWLCSLQLAFSFYNPNTGSWLNRDPLGEEAGTNLYAANEQNPIGQIDFLGLKVLLFPVARDWTLRGPVGGTYDIYVKKRNPVMQNGLQEVIDKCTSCTSLKADVKLIYAEKMILPVPDDIRNNKRESWNIGIQSDLDLMFADYDKLSKDKKSAPVFWTLRSIVDPRGATDAAGVGTYKKGITLSYQGNNHFRHLLAHELGHFAGLGHAPETDTANVMHATSDGANPDADYCKKVLELFK